MTFKDHFSGHADRYTRYRPHYPRALFEFLATLPISCECAWDCGTGNGQAAVALAEFFQYVVATDPSKRQIEHAQPHTGVEYRAAPAEVSGLAPQSIDLITVAQAAHWFELDRFYGEVRRVGKPGGAIALWSYGLATISPEIDAIVGRLYGEILDDYWPPERRLVEQRYATLAFPFVEVPAPDFTMSERWNLEELVGYLQTWSSVRKYLEQRGTDPLTLVRAELISAWGPADESRQICWPIHLRVGKLDSLGRSG